MTGLVILGAIVLLFLILLLAPVSLRLGFQNGEVSARLHYLFFRLDLSPEGLEKRAERKKRKEKPVPPEPEKQEPSEKAEASKKKKGTLQVVRQLLFSTPKGVHIIRRHLVFYRVQVCINVAGEDAHQTALSYGRVCSFTSVALALLGELFILRPASIQIYPDFVHPKSQYHVSLRLRIALFFLLRAGNSVLYTFIKSVYGKKSAPSGYTKKKRTSQKSKGGKTNESDTSHQ